MNDETTFFVKLIAALVTVILLPLAALVVYFLKRGPDQALNGLGERVNAVEKENLRLSTMVVSLQASMAESQRDVLEAIRASSEAQIRAVHLVEIEVARLQERNDLGECLSRFGASIEKLAQSLHDQGGKQHA